jgi:hypothetical protein
LVLLANQLRIAADLTLATTAKKKAASYGGPVYGRLMIDQAN